MSLLTECAFSTQISHAIYCMVVDGVGEIHDKRRPLRSGAGTFNKILENIINAPKFNGRFLFRVSFDKNNLKDVKKLLSYLSDEF